MSRETKAQIQARNAELEGDLIKMAEHRDELQETVDSLNNQLSVSRQRVDLLEHTAMELALSTLEAVQDAHESRKVAAAATRRADKLGAKLVRRGLELGRERRAWVSQAKGREKALQNAVKRAQGLQESLRKSLAQTAQVQVEKSKVMALADSYRESNQDLRRKLRASNKSVLMASLGGGLEVRPASGLQHEDTTGYSPAAHRAAGGQ